MKSVIKVFLVLSMSVLIFTTCDNSIGLGPKVNTEKPVIKTPEDEKNGPGSFLQGTDNRIYLEVEQEFGIAKVYMEVEYIDIEDPNADPKPRKIIEAIYDKEKGQWYVNLDTTGMEDGSIKAWVTAIDVDGNKTTTTDIVYFVKNTPPQIKLNMPLVEEGNWDNDEFLDNLKNLDPLYLGFELLGLATDNYGIAKGYPKIMIWPANEPIAMDKDGLPLLEDPDDDEADGGLYGTWRSLVVPNPDREATATKFSWPMMILKEDPTAPGGYRLPAKGEPKNSLNEGIYRIRLVTKDLFGNKNFYPDRKDHGTNMASKKYIEINYKASDVPIVQVTEAPANYNTVKDFEVYLAVSSKNPVDSVDAYVVDGNSGYENISGGKYTPVYLENESSGALYKYKLTITSAQAKAWTHIPEKGLMYVRINATSGDKTGPNAYHNFIHDVEPPEVILDRPVSLQNSVASGTMDGGTYNILYPAKDKPKWVTGIITVGGTAKDNFTLKEVYYHIGKLDDDKKTQAERDVIYNNPDNWTNTNLHFTSPAAGWKGSPYSWTYTFDVFANNYKTTFEGAQLIQEYDDLLSGYLDKNQYSITIAADGDPEKARFYLPFYVKVTDSADNFRIIHYKLSVDPLLDEPIVTITQPEIKQYTGDIPVPPTVGGTVRIAGFAEDNNWMHTVLVRVKKDDGTYPSGTLTHGGYYLPNTSPPVTAFYLNNPTYPKPKKGAIDDTDGWFMATKVGDSNNVNWYASINQDRKLDPATSGTTVPVTVEVIAIDCDEGDSLHKTPHIVGPIETLKLKFSKDVPMIDAKILKNGVDDRDYVEGIRASGKFTFSFKVDAIDDINTLTARINGASAPVNLLIETEPQSVDGVWNIGTKITNGAKKERTITVIIDSTTNPITGLGSTATGFPYGKTGELTLEIMAEDATTNNLTTTNTFVIGIDNFYPTAVITTLNVAADNPGKGKYYYIAGHVKDYDTGTGNVQGLERVLVYFQKANITYPGGVRTVSGRNNLYVRPNGGGVLGDGDFESYPDVLDHHGATTTALLAPNTAPTSPSSPFNWFPKHTDYTYDGVEKWQSDVALVIDNIEGGGTNDTDGDGTEGETWDGPSSDKEFGARVNFAGWADGPYMVHYILMDKAGNATHYQHDIYLENNKPRITKINFGTDITGDGAAKPEDNEYLYPYPANLTIDEPTAAYIAGVLSPSLRIRGNLFKIELDVEKGNSNNKYTVTYVTEAGTIPASTMKRGHVYTIVDPAPGASETTTIFTRFGAPNNIPGTTFVAAGPATGPGTVKSYTEGARGNYTLSNTGGPIGFIHFNNIPDSTKVNGTITVNNDRLFVIKVYDTTVSAANNESPDEEYDQLADILLVKVDIDNNDDKDPSINVLPFGEEYIIPVGKDPANDETKSVRNLPFEEYNKNISMNETSKEGYVQYAKDNVPVTAIANISGKVKFLGKAEDNQRIGSIWVKIDGYRNGSGAYGDLFQVAHISGKSLVADTPANSGEWSFDPKMLDNKDYLTLDYGHTLNWEFMWDSSKHQNVAQNNVNVTFEIHDAANHIQTNTIKVNIVPYISEVYTTLSGAYPTAPSVFNRSALGGYPVRETESITIRGFNLGSVVSNAKINGTALSGGSNDGTSISSTVPAAATSGPLVVTVNAIDSFNNSDNKNKTVLYNKEPNNVNNNILDNGRYIYVWNTGDLFNDGTYYTTTNGFNTTPSGTTATIAMKDVSYPFMRLDRDGNRLISHGFYNLTQSGRLRVLKNKTIIEVGLAATNRMVYTSVGTGGKNLSFYAAGTDLSSNADYNRGFQIGFSNDAGTNSISGHTAPSTINATNYGAHGDIRIYQTNASAHDDRFMIPRIAVLSGADRSSTDDKVLLSYYDSDNKRVEAVYDSVGNNTNMAAGRFPITNASNNRNTYNGTKHLISSSGSEYTAAGILSTGVPLVAWYDSTGEKLYIAYGTVSSGTTVSSWTTTEIDSKKGAYVDMAVDGGNNVHLAYYSSDGGLWYAHIPYSGSALNMGGITKRRVDTYLSAGTRLMINVREETTPSTRYVPYISYAHASFPGTRLSVRVAWLASGSDFNDHGTDDNNMFTGKWEVMTVPVNRIPTISDYICNGVPGVATWNTEGTTLTYNANLNRTIVIGYMTSSVYEGAILKGDISDIPAILKK